MLEPTFQLCATGWYPQHQNLECSLLHNPSHSSLLPALTQVSTPTRATPASGHQKTFRASTCHASANHWFTPLLPRAYTRFAVWASLIHTSVHPIARTGHLPGRGQPTPTNTSIDPQNYQWWIIFIQIIFSSVRCHPKYSRSPMISLLISVCDDWSMSQSDFDFLEAYDFDLLEA